MKVLGRMGKDSASSAQSKCGGVGTERDGIGIDRLLTRYGGCKMADV
jgi:hypothetical protein